MLCSFHHKLFELFTYIKLVHKKYKRTGMDSDMSYKKRRPIKSFVTDFTWKPAFTLFSLWPLIRRNKTRSS